MVARPCEFESHPAHNFTNEGFSREFPSFFVEPIETLILPFIHLHSFFVISITSTNGTIFAKMIKKFAQSEKIL